MRELVLFFAVAPALAVSACDVAPVEVAPTGGRPAIVVPVGPIPGPAQESSFVTNPYSRDPVALEQGRKLFVWYNCAGCHGGHAGGGMGPSLRDRTWLYGSSDGHVFNSIAAGRANGMPAWGVKVPEEQIWKLVAYVASLGTPLEPEPPTVEQIHTKVEVGR